MKGLDLAEAYYVTHGAPMIASRFGSCAQGFGPREVSAGEESRTGVGKISAFYRTYTGLDHVPTTLSEWLNISESSLATCTNGRIFTDPLGEFSLK